MKNLFWFENKRSCSTRLWCKKELMTSLTTNEFYFHMLLTMSMVSYQSFYLHHYHHWGQHHHHMISTIFSKGWNNTLFNFILLLLGTDTYRYVEIACVLTSVWSFVIIFDVHTYCRVKLIILFEIRIVKIEVKRGYENCSSWGLDLFSFTICECIDLKFLSVHQITDKEYLKLHFSYDEWQLSTR